MKNLYIKAQKSSPEVSFNFNEHELFISGQSYPENSREFFAPVLEWLREYVKVIDNSVYTIFNFKLIYINTSSSKYVMTILDILEAAYATGKPITVNWFYNPQNDVAQESGEDFKEDLDLPFFVVPDTY